MAELSLSKLLLQSRGQEVMKKIAMVNAFKITETTALPVRLVPVNTEKDEAEKQYFLNGKETITQVTWNICRMYGWDEVDLTVPLPLSALLTTGPIGEVAPVKTTAMLNALIE